jgi:hypothetical protein
VKIGRSQGKQEKRLKHLAKGSGRGSTPLFPTNHENKLKKACEIIGIKFLNHLVISSESFYSYADEDKFGI